MTLADIEFIARTGALEVASAGWQVFGWIVVGLFAAAYVALFLLTDVRGSWPHRYEAPAPEEVGDDAIALVKQARADDQAEADAIAAMEAAWQETEGKRDA